MIISLFLGEDNPGRIKIDVLVQRSIGFSFTGVTYFLHICHAKAILLYVVILQGTVKTCGIEMEKNSRLKDEKLTLWHHVGFPVETGLRS
jgi:hypothetical protein